MGQFWCNCPIWGHAGCWFSRLEEQWNLIMINVNKPILHQKNIFKTSYMINKIKHVMQVSKVIQPINPIVTLMFIGTVQRQPCLTQLTVCIGLLFYRHGRLGPGQPGVIFFFFFLCSYMVEITAHHY